MVVYLINGCTGPSPAITASFAGAVAEVVIALFLSGFEQVINFPLQRAGLSRAILARDGMLSLLITAARKRGLRLTSRFDVSVR